MSSKLLPLAAVLAAAGCQPAAPPAAVKTPATAAPDDADEHDHGPGPHKGTVIEFGKWHGEFCVDHGRKEVTVYILSGNLKRPVAIAADTLTLTVTRPPLTVELRAVPQETDELGKASRFVATHPAFGVEQEFAGTVSGKVEGKAYSGRFAEQPDAHGHDHKH